MMAFRPRTHHARALRCAISQHCPKPTLNITPIIQRQLIHTSPSKPATLSVPESRLNRELNEVPTDVSAVQNRFADFDQRGRVFVVTGGGRGLGLAMAEGLAEAGGKVHCLDLLSLSQDFQKAQARVVPDYGGSLHYHETDICDTPALNDLIGSIAAQDRRIDGLITAAAIQQITPALDYTPEDAKKMLDINYTGTLMTATAVARQMFKYDCPGSMCFIASMSGLIANKGLISPVYNSSKAAVIQLARNLAMEWSPKGIRVNCLSPGHIVTPMVLKNFEEVPGLKEKWEGENLMGRLSGTEEYKGAVLFLLSRASTFMTGGNLIIDGGHTVW